MTDVSAPLRDLEKRLAQDPDNLQLRVEVATLLSQVGRTGDAARLLRSVAFAYREGGRHDEAVAIARSILDMVSADPELHTLVAELEHRDDDVTETRSGGVVRDEPTLVEPALAVAPISERAHSASVAALITRPRIHSRPPPLRAQVARQSAHSVMSEDTPLPGALPYHIAEPTTPASSGPFGVFGVRPDPSTSSKVAGLAEAARRISGLIADDPDSEGSSIHSELRSAGPGWVSDTSHDLAQHRAGIDGEEELTSPRTLMLSDRLSDPMSHAAGRSAPGDPGESVRGDNSRLPTAPASLRPTRRGGNLQADGAGGSDPLANLFFASLPEADRAAALQKFDSRCVSVGTIIIRRGAPAQPLIAVVRGKLELRVERANSPAAILDTIEAGYYIGEAVLLGRPSAPATVIAAVDCDLLTLAPHALFELASAYPALWAALKDTAERRTRRYDAIIRALP